MISVSVANNVVLTVPIVAVNSVLKLRWFQSWPFSISVLYI